MEGFDRRTFIALAGAAAVTASAAAAANTQAIPSATGRLSDFDFQEGHWRVRHRSRSSEGTWSAFDGRVSMQKVMGGHGNVEDHQWERDGQIYRAMGVRTFDPNRSVWSIFWLDSRWPSAFGTPVIGGFTGNRGTFYSAEEVNGRPALSRFIWLVDDRDHCRWEQASSFDDGMTWDTNWRMAFTRI